MPMANGTAARAQLMQSALQGAGGMNLGAGAAGGGPLRGGPAMMQPGLGGGAGGAENPLLAMIKNAGAAGLQPPYPLSAASLQQQLGAANALQMNAGQQPFAAALSQQAAANLSARIAAAQAHQQQQAAQAGVEDSPAFDPSDFPSLGPTGGPGRAQKSLAEGYAAAISQGLQAPPDIHSDEFPALAGDRGLDGGLLAALGGGAQGGQGFEQLLRAQQAQQQLQLRAGAQSGAGYPGMMTGGAPGSGATATKPAGAGAGAQSSSGDRFGILGLMTVPRLNDSDLSMLAVGIDLTTLGLNLSAPDDVLLSKSFISPWFGDAVVGNGASLLRLPSCYLQVQPQRLAPGCFSQVKSTETLLYVFYSSPNDEAQLYAADELCSRGWAWHKELRQWFIRAPGTEASVGDGFEVGSYLFFDADRWDSQRKDNTKILHAQVEAPPNLSAVTA